ncbi:MAG TPA: histidine kinase [Usitatibacter sp.]|nr:histidine kinase [Usitatibacter sp.]
MPAATPPPDCPSPHPLELIPFFRRFPPGRARNLLYTLIWSSIFGVTFLLVNVALTAKVPTARAVATFGVISNLIGFAIHALYSAGSLVGLDAWARRASFPVKTAYFSIIPLVGVIAGMQAADWIFHIGFSNWLVSPTWLLSIASTTLVISLVISTLFYLREREARTQAELARERETVERMQREAVAANLRALQAQIEPHFLFNTLANVSSLIDRDAREAKHMLERFILFLRASLAATRTERTSLGAERDLIAAYLDVLRVRMGPRLQYDVQVDPALAASPIAPMLLQPIVENAIRHGIEPKVEGGRIDLHARREGASAVIEIRDTGMGFGATTTGGVGLTNLRDRLRGLYGTAASLSIGENRPNGTVVTLRIPA